MIKGLKQLLRGSLVQGGSVYAFLLEWLRMRILDQLVVIDGLLYQRVLHQYHREVFNVPQGFEHIAKFSSEFLQAFLICLNLDADHSHLIFPFFLLLFN